MPKLTPPGWVQWDGRDFAAIQLLLTDARADHEPACRLPDGDMSRMEVRTGNGQWVWVQPGDRVALADDGTAIVVAADLAHCDIHLRHVLACPICRGAQNVRDRMNAAQE
jgi:hypothetical protein